MRGGVHTRRDSVRGMMKFLIVDLNYIGDVLMSSPVARCLVDNYPASVVDMVTYSASADVVRANPYIDHVYGVSRWWALPWRTLRAERYDVAMQLNTSLRTNLSLALLGAKATLSYSYRGSGWPCTLSVPLETRTARSGGRIDECLALLEIGLDCEVKDRRMVLELPECEFTLPPEIQDANMLIGFHVSCRPADHWRRFWPVEKWAALGDLLVRRYGCAIIFTGGVDEARYAEMVRALMLESKSTHSFSGRLSFLQSAWLVTKLSLLVTVNTSMMHVAIAKDVPSVALIGGTPAKVVHPFHDPRHRYIEDPALKNYDPWNPARYKPELADVPVAAVLAEVETLIDYLGRCDAERSRA